jgi:hypothetical protein
MNKKTEFEKLSQVLTLVYQEGVLLPQAMPPETIPSKV